jgi:hypothetical protein
MQARELSEFNEVTIFNKMNLTIRQGNDYKIEIVCGKNLLKNISTEVNNGVLYIENNNKCNFVRGYKKTINIILIVPFIKKVVNNGVGPISFDENFKQDTVTVRANSSGDIYVNGTFVKIKTSSHGNGDVYINGKTDTLYVYMNGTNFVEAKELKIANYVFVETFSIGNCSVNSPQNGPLECNIWSDGNINYYGMPAYTTNFSKGSQKGRLIKAD